MTKLEGFGNWIPDTNRYALPAPPQWFLKALWDQDAGLVILPSRSRRLYVLARKRELSLRAPLMVKAHNDLLRRTRGSDGDMLASHNLQFVDVIKGNPMGTWSPAIIQDLKDRDTWVKGSDHYIKQVEEADSNAAKQVKSAWLDDIDQRAKDSWRSYQARTGQRNHHARNSGLRVKSSSSRTAGLARQGWKVSTPSGLSAGEAQ